MVETFKNNRLPILVTAGALILVIIIGWIPVSQQNDTESTPASGSDETASLLQRIEALEAAAGQTGAGSPEIPENADNGRLRQEIDLINRGLANQTGRVSRIKKQLEAVVDDGGQAIPSARAMDEIALIKRALVNLTKRLNAMDDQFASLTDAAADIDRLQQQMANADRAFIRLAGAAREGKKQRDQISDSQALEERHLASLAALLREEKQRRDELTLLLGDIQKAQSEVAEDYADMRRLKQVLHGILETLPE